MASKNPTFCLNGKPCTPAPIPLHLKEMRGGRRRTLVAATPSANMPQEQHPGDIIFDTFIDEDMLGPLSDLRPLPSRIAEPVVKFRIKTSEYLPSCAAHTIRPPRTCWLDNLRQETASPHLIVRHVDSGFPFPAAYLRGLRASLDPSFSDAYWADIFYQSAPNQPKFPHLEDIKRPYYQNDDNRCVLEGLKREAADFGMQRKKVAARKQGVSEEDMRRAFKKWRPGQEGRTLLPDGYARGIFVNQLRRGMVVNF